MQKALMCFVTYLEIPCKIFAVSTGILEHRAQPEGKVGRKSRVVPHRIRTYSLALANIDRLLGL